MRVCVDFTFAEVRHVSWLHYKEGLTMANDTALALRLPSSLGARLAALVPLLDSDPRFALTAGSGSARVARVALLYGIERLESELKNPGLFPAAGPIVSTPKKGKTK